MKIKPKFAAKDNNDKPKGVRVSLRAHPKKQILASQEAILLSNTLHGVKNGVSFKEYRRNHMAKVRLLYKLPKIVKCTNGDWYVQYYYRHPETFKWIAHKQRCGINYIKDIDQKQIEADSLCEIVAGWLKDGNGPYDPESDIKTRTAPVLADVRKIKASKKAWTISEAISEFRIYIDNQGYAGSTISSYKKYVKAFETWLTANNYDDHIAAAITEMEVDEFLQKYNTDNKWSERTFNNYLEFMITFFQRIVKLEKKKTKNRHLKYDFDPGELEAKITTPQRNKAFTPLMLTELKKELAKRNESDLKDYLEWIFLSLMRPAEIRELRIADIDEASRQIRINGKTGDRIIPVSDQLLRLINRRELLSKSLTSYVFGYAGKADERRMSVEYFLGKFSPVRIKLGLDENFGPYSMKPTGVIAMINAGFTDEEIRGLTGHKTVEAFRTYKRDLVIENSHVMKGSTIEF